MAFSTRSSTLVLVVLALVAVLPQINAQCNPNLYESLKNNPLLERFTEAIDLSDLEDRIKNTDNVTVLAPTNDAFNGTNGLYQVLQLNNLTLQQVTSGNDNRVASVVLYHFLPTPATAAQLQNRQSLPTALNGRNLTVSKVTTGTTTNVTFLGAASNSTVLTADLRVCNSIVHIVNRVLLPASAFNQIPVYNESGPAPGIASGATSFSQAVGVWAFALSGALAAALMM
jgi:uncharacterized surface protein with fasciclin (FAS1) repeats